MQIDVSRPENGQVLPYKRKYPLINNYIYRHLLVFVFFLICSPAPSLEADTKSFTAGIVSSFQNTHCEIVSDTNTLEYDSQKAASFGLFISYEHIGLQVGSLCLPDENGTTCARLNISATAALSHIYSVFSVKSAKAFSLAAPDYDIETDYDNMQTLQLSHTLLYYFSENIPLQNIYLGTGKRAAENGGSFCCGYNAEFMQFENSYNLFDETVFDEFADTYYEFRKLTRTALSPLIGGIYTFVLMPSLSFSCAAAAGPALVYRNRVTKDQGGTTLSLFFPGKIHYTACLNYDTSITSAKIAFEYSNSPPTGINSTYKFQSMENSLHFVCGYKF